MHGQALGTVTHWLFQKAMFRPTHMKDIYWETSLHNHEPAGSQGSKGESGCVRVLQGGDPGEPMV